MVARTPIAIGSKYDRLTILSELPSRNGRRFVFCRCDCGTEKAVNLQSLLYGLILSCGCKRREINSVVHRTHGYAGNGHKNRTTEYRIWSLMIQRCENPKNPAFDRYGGRGISVCERWHKFESFLADMGDRPAGRSLDREDNERGYEPGNCRWATRIEQGRNTRRARLLTLNGETMNVSAWAQRLGINSATLSERLEKWPLERALTAPARRWPSPEIRVGRPLS
jgi:hypothetical protein